MNSTKKDRFYNDCIKKGFLPDEDNTDYCSAGKTLKVDEKSGHGTYWIYEHSNLFNIRIHDFSFTETQTMTFRYYDCMSITKYDEITGTELPSGRKLKPGCIKAFIGGLDRPYKLTIPAGTRISSIGIEILPAFYEDYLKKLNPEEYHFVMDAFLSFDQATDFPEMSTLLSEIRAYRGTGLTAQLFYSAKVSEALSLLVHYHESDAHRLNASDSDAIHNVTTYIDRHFTESLPLKELERIACMGTTKLQNTFRTYHGCTITVYIQQKRMALARQLLQNTSLSISEIAAKTVYKKPSHFSEIFKKTTGTLPLKYRKSHAGD